MDATDIDFSTMSTAEVATVTMRMSAEEAKFKKAAENGKKELRKRLEVGKTHPIGKLNVKVSPTLRFDAALAEEVLPPTKFKKILVAKPDATLAKAILTKAEYESTRKKFENAISISVKE